MVEGKDKPKNKDCTNEFEKYGATTHLLLECCKTIFHTGRVVILDSGFCVLKAITKLREYGVYASAVIKKRRYWPTLVKGELIEKHMMNKQIGECDSISGKLDGVNYNIFCMKDSQFTMKLMSTYGTLTIPTNQTDTFRKTDKGEKKSFKYTECFLNHYKYRHSVDDHNNLRHRTPSIEDSWKTKRWAIRVFFFLLAISEVNAFLAYRYFILDKTSQPKMTLILFRCKLAIQLIHNDHWKKDLVMRGKKESKEKRKSKRHYVNTRHTLCTAPNHASFFYNNTWTCKAKTKYPQYTCKGVGCNRKVRSYCQCSPEQWMCNECFLTHFETSITNDIIED